MNIFAIEGDLETGQIDWKSQPDLKITYGLSK